MVYRIGLLIEVSLMLLCLYDFYGTKFKLGIKELGIVAFDMVLMEIIRWGYLPDVFAVLIYPMFVIYGILIMRKGVVQAVVNFFGALLIMSGLQLVSATLLLLLRRDMLEDQYGMILLYVVMAVLYAIVRKVVPLKRISDYFQRKDVIMNCIFIVGVILTVIALIITKDEGNVPYIEYVIIALLVLIMFALAIGWFRYKEKALRAQLQLQAYELYGETFDKLITDIRMKQHGFQDHINTIYAQHLTCNSLEELVAKQKQYCDNLVEDNRYYKLLSLKSSVIAGFLYSKFLDAEEKGINVNYDVDVRELDVIIPEYKFVDILGNLINNALDALDNQSVKRLDVSVKETDEECVIQVANTGDEIQPDQLSRMFKKNYSSKGENRGLGLYILKTMSKEYDFDIECANEIVDMENMVQFTIVIKKNRK